MARLKNASTCYRRAVCLDRLNHDAVTGLISIAKEGIALDNSFDNQLLLGGAYFISGDFERCQMDIRYQYFLRLDC